MTEIPMAPAETQEESALLAGLRAGDDSAYEKLVRAYSGRLLAVARRYLRNEEDARDAVQEAFGNAFRALPSFQADARLSTWLHRIVVNACLMRLRRRRRKPEESIDEMLPSFVEGGHLAEPAAPWRDDAATLLEREENRSAVREAIDRLPESYRTVLLLRDIEDFDTDQTAENLGISRAAVKTRLHRARMALRTQLDSEFR